MPLVVAIIIEPEPIETYDIVYCERALQSVELSDVKKTIDALAKYVRQDGELWILTYSLDWLCNEILKSVNVGVPLPPMVLPMLLGAQQHHRSAFTLLSLRRLAESTGMITKLAGQEAFNGQSRWERHAYSTQQVHWL